MGSVALLAVLTACQMIEAKPGYVLTIPQILRAGAEESICISLHGAEEPSFPFILRLAHKDTHEEHDFEYEISESLSQCMKLTVPSETGNYNVSVLNSTTESAQSAPTEVEVKSQNLITLIQTDKPIYKPGQKIRFRVLTLTRDLRTRTGLIQSIYIKNPNDIRVKQWLNIQSEGMTSFNYPMPEEPKLGDWKIEVTIEGETVVETFKVEEYVLPRFEVTITPPAYLLVNASSIDGKVCAEYTYGKPVEGYVSLEMCLAGYRSTGRPCYYETREIKGCYKFSINSDEVAMSNTKYYLYGSKLQITASVKELNTGAMVNKTSKEPSVTYDPLKITLEDDTNGYFKPNFPYHGRARVTTPDGRPAPNEVIKVIAVDHRNDIRLASNYTTDSEGVVHFSVCDLITEKTEDFSIEARAVLYSEPDTIQGYSNSLYMPRGYTTVRQWFSPSKSYISIPRATRLVPCGDTLEVDIPYSTTLNSFTKFYYQVMSRGSILQTGHKLHHFLKHDSTEFLQVPMETCLQEVPLPSPPPEVSEGVQGSEVEEPPAESFLREPMQASALLSGVRRKRATGELAKKEGKEKNPLGETTEGLADVVHEEGMEELNSSATNITSGEDDKGGVHEATVGVMYDAALPFTSSSDAPHTHDVTTLAYKLHGDVKPMNTKRVDDVDDIGNGTLERKGNETGDLTLHAKTNTDIGSIKYDASDTNSSDMNSMKARDLLSNNNQTLTNETESLPENILLQHVHIEDATDNTNHSLSVHNIYQSDTGMKADNSSDTNLGNFEDKMMNDSNLVSNGTQSSDNVTMSSAGLVNSTESPVEVLEPLDGDMVYEYDDEDDDDYDEDDEYEEYEDQLVRNQINENIYGREPISAAIFEPFGLRRKRSIETEIGEQESVEGEKVEGGEEAQEEPPMSPPPPPPSRHVSHFTLKIPVTEEMSPEASLLVYYVRDDGETVADSITFKVEACFKNKVNMEFAEKKVVPGGEATLRLQAQPGSLCSIGVVDKSINILGGDHQITPEKMFDILKKEYWMAPDDHRYYSKNQEYCKTKAEGNEKNLDPHMSYFSSSYVDAVQAFRQAGMAVVTNMELETRPCKREMMRFFDSDMTPVDGGLPGPGFGMPLPLGINYRNSEKKKPPTSTLRSYFPETWLWELEKVSESGVLEMKKSVPHTITKWVGNSLCTNPEVGLGVSPITSLTTFQPFFLSMKLPYAAVRGERFPLHVTLYNYLDRCLNMQLTVETGEGLTVVIRDHLKLPFCLCGGKTKTQSYYLNAEKIGRIPVFAKAKIVTGTCDNNVELDTEYEGLTDAVKRELLVKGEGVVQEYSRSFYLCPQASEPIQEALVLPLPDDIVPESARGTVSVIGDIMGPALTNLDNLVQLPTGCGEQTMINFAPNIYVLKYLTFTMQLTEGMKLLTETYMETGYNRELTYAHPDGSFSAFGEKDTSGSTWLTAFVLKCFAQAQRFIFIDQTVMDKSISFLKSTVMENGCFREVGKVFSSYMMGGLNKISGEDDTALTAFVVVALLEANTPSSDRVLSGALRCVSMQPLDEMDTYTLSLVAYALALNDTTSEHTGRAMDELNKRVISDGIVGYWGREGSRPDAVNTWHYVTAPSAEIEMTSYGLMATLLYYSDDAITRAQPYVLWLSQQRSAFGGFSSTQDTVLGLQALSEFASKTYTSDPTDLTVRFEGDGASTTFDVMTGVNTLLLQQEPVKSLPANLSLSVNGTGCVLAQANVKFNKQPKDLGVDRELFDLSVAVRRSRKKRSDCARRSMRICVSFHGNDDVSAGMTMLTVKMVTAWTPVLDSLMELKSVFTNLGIKRYENDIEKGLIVFYFEELDVRARCFEMDVEQDRELAVTDPKPAQIQAYQYYETDATAITSYKIKTTCGTKAEIPLEETDERWVPGVPIPVQVRVSNDMVPRPISEQRRPGCPVCLHDKPDNFDELICQSNAIYKALAGRTGKAPMKIQADLRPKKKRKIIKFASFSLNGGCQCDLLHPPKSRRRLRRLLILAGSENSFVQRETAEHDAVNHTINLDENSVIIHLDTNKKLERETRKKAKKCSRKLL